MFAKVRGPVLNAVFSVVGTTLAIQAGWLGPANSFINNLFTVAVIWGISRLLAKVIGSY